MSGKLSAAQIDWTADFLKMPSLGQSATPVRQASDPEEPPDPASPYAYAPAGTPAAAGPAPPDDAPPSDPVDKSKFEFVRSDRLAELDDAVSSGLLEQMQEAQRQAGQMKGIAAIHGVDLDHPDAALEPLKKTTAGALDNHDQAELEIGLGLVNTAKEPLNNALIFFRAESMRLRRSLETVRTAPMPPQAKTEENEPEDDTTEHSHDAIVQGLKFIIELPGIITDVTGTLLQVVGGYASAMLEFAGLDLVKDTVKGGNSDELLASLKTAVDELQGKVGEIIEQLKNDALKQAADTRKTLISLLRAVLDEYGNFVSVANRFDKRLKAAMKKVMAAHGGKRSGASEYEQGIMAVHQAVLDAAKAGQAVQVALSRHGKVVEDLRYWESVLVPLGKRQRDGRVMSGDANQYMVYLRGSRQIAFILPSGGLKSSLEDLSGAIEMMRKLDSDGGAEVEAVRQRWMSAMVDAL
jgi:hypothetical protein